MNIWWLFMTTYDYAWLWMTIYDYCWLCITMYDYVWLCMTINDYVWRCMTMSKYLWTCMTMSKYVWLYVWSCRTMYDYLGTSSRRSGQLAFGRSTVNNVNGHYKRLYFFFIFSPLSTFLIEGVLVSKTLFKSWRETPKT